MCPSVPAGTELPVAGWLSGRVSVYPSVPVGQSSQGDSLQLAGRCGGVVSHVTQHPQGLLGSLLRELGRRVVSRWGHLQVARVSMAGFVCRVTAEHTCKGPGILL